ncbi:TnsA-like heteromeric transposase endonuclease subunit [Mycolicibacterium frederiksbergense]|uniref:TnsA-like heteromeric transposase endonuclease subunit n=1 Tax=Mycolicibacterium frederiksbergense TaxID=117567 RepID=A0A6H0S4F3_9MYCO|nr:TnsA-like heteromeric transposase endonuclease subunit [Mycolicibacterium frederiksbergense]
MSSAEFRFRPAIRFIVPSRPTWGHRTLKLVGLIQREHATDVDDHHRWHVPDYLFDTESGPVVVDVVRAGRMDHPRVVRLCRWTKLVVESLGWSYKIVNEPDIVRMGNVRFLAGYRREWLINQDILSELRCRRDELVGLPMLQAEAVIAGRPKPLVRPALLSMLWRHEFEVNLDHRLGRATVLEQGL